MTIELDIHEYEQAVILITKVNIDNKRTVYTAWNVSNPDVRLLTHNTNLDRLYQKLISQKYK